MSRTGVGLLLLGFSGTLFGACSEQELTDLGMGGDWKPGALVWAGADDIPVRATPGESVPPTRYLDFNSRAAVIRDHVEQDGQIWLQVEDKQRLDWIPADHPGVICRNRPLRDEHNRLFRKVIAKIDNRAGKDPLIEAQRRIGDQASDDSIKIGVFDYFFVFSESDAWRLLGRSSVLDQISPSLLGWVQAEDLVRWDTRLVAASNPGTWFLDRPNGRRLVKTTGGWDPAERRPPVIDKKTDDKGTTWLKTVVPVDPKKNRTRSQNLISIAEASANWQRPLVAFLIDGTESTLPYLEEIHGILDRLLSELTQTAKENGTEVRYALYSYTDTAYGPYHTRRYLGATSDRWSIRRAFEKLKRDTKTIETQRRGDDDFYEDIYAGIERVIHEEFTPEVLANSLPFLVIIGDHGSRPSDHLGRAARTILNDKDSVIVPFLIQMGSGIGRQACPPVPTTNQQQRDCAFERFEQDARTILGNRFGSGENFTSGADESAVVQSFKRALEANLDWVKELLKVTDRIATGASWEEARAASGWPLAYSEAFRSLLLQKGFSEEVLEEGDLIATHEAWIAETDVSGELFLTRKLVYRWSDLFDRMQDSGNWSPERVQEIIAGAVAIVAKQDDISSLTLSEALWQLGGIPLQVTRLLDVTIGELQHLDDDRVRYYADLFSKYSQLLGYIASGKQPIVNQEKYEYRDWDSFSVLAGDPHNRWFPFADGVTAAYIPLDWLP